jgi:hypothetical protein
MGKPMVLTDRETLERGITSSVSLVYKNSLEPTSAGTGFFSINIKLSYKT